MASFLLAALFCISFGHGVSAATPGVLVYTGMNNVHKWLPEPNVSVGSVRHLGKFKSPDECVDACLSMEGGRCLSFTYHSLEFEGGFAGHCYGRLEDPAWAPMPTDNVVSGRVMWPCMSDMDCSLNGKCMTGGHCRCTPAWRGFRCDTLSLEPAERHSGYHFMTDGKNVSSWGGAVVRNDKDGTYHMYAAEMANHCGLNTWQRNSQIVHAISNNPTGTYKRQEIVRQPFAHEPDVVKGPNGEFVMYWSTSSKKYSLCNCSDGSTSPGCGGEDIRYLTLMSYTISPEGPWSNPVPVLPPNPREQDTNLAVVIMKDGSLVGFSRYGYWGYNGSRIFLVTASNWKDPNTYKQAEHEMWPHMPNAGTEDPFMYLDGDGNFHAIFHNKFPDNTPDCVGGHAYSEDGKSWVYGGRAYGNVVQFTDGESFTFSRKERPHLVFAADGFTPLALTTGAQYGGTYGDATYTMLQPVTTQP